MSPDSLLVYISSPVAPVRSISRTEDWRILSYHSNTHNDYNSINCLTNEIQNSGELAQDLWEHHILRYVNQLLYCYYRPVSNHPPEQLSSTSNPKASQTRLDFTLVTGSQDKILESWWTMTRPHRGRPVLQWIFWMRRTAVDCLLEFLALFVHAVAHELFGTLVHRSTSGYRGTVVVPTDMRFAILVSQPPMMH
jgi:hypothetical protein